MDGSISSRTTPGSFLSPRVPLVPLVSQTSCSTAAPSEHPLQESTWERRGLLSTSLADPCSLETPAPGARFVYRLLTSARWFSGRLAYPVYPTEGEVGLGVIRN